METRLLKSNEQSLGDATVDGLLAGAAAGLVMALFLVGAGALDGRAWTAVLARFDPGISASPLVGAVTHLAVASVYGAIFGATWRVAGRRAPRLPAWVAGVLYGVALWLVALAVTSSGSAAAAGGGWLSGIPPVQLAAGHMLYGLALGLLIARLPRR